MVYVHALLSGFEVSVREYAAVPGRGCSFISVSGRGEVKLHSGLSPLQNTIFVMFCNIGKEEPAARYMHYYKVMDNKCLRTSGAV